MDIAEMIIDFGSTKKVVRITAPNGSGGQYHLIIDNYYIGTLVKRDEEWVGHLREGAELTADDIMIIGGLIDSKKS